MPVRDQYPESNEPVQPNTEPLYEDETLNRLMKIHETFMHDAYGYTPFSKAEVQSAESQAPIDPEAKRAADQALVDAVAATVRNTEDDLSFGMIGSFTDDPNGEKPKERKQLLSGAPLPAYLSEEALGEAMNWRSNKGVKIDKVVNEEQMADLSEDAKEVVRLQHEYRSITHDIRAANRATGSKLETEQQAFLAAEIFAYYQTTRKQYTPCTPDDIYDTACRYDDMYSRAELRSRTDPDEKPRAEVLEKMTDTKEAEIIGLEKNAGKSTTTSTPATVEKNNGEKTKKQPKLIDDVLLPPYISLKGLEEASRWNGHFYYTDEQGMAGLSKDAKEVIRLQTEYRRIIDDIRYAGKFTGNKLGFEEKRRLAADLLLQFQYTRSNYQAYDPKNLGETINRYMAMYSETGFVFPKASVEEEYRSQVLAEMVKIKKTELDQQRNTSRQRGVLSIAADVGRRHKARSENQGIRDSEAESRTLYTLPRNRQHYTVGEDLGSIGYIGKVIGREFLRQGALLTEEVIVKPIAKSSREFDEKELGRERPEYKQQGEELREVLLAEGANIGDSKSGLTVRKATGLVDGVEQEYVVFSTVPEIHRNALGTIRSGDILMPPDRNIQVQHIEADGTRRERRPVRSDRRKEAAQHLGIITTVATEFTGVLYQSELSDWLANATDAQSEAARIATEVAPIVGSVLTAAAAGLGAMKLASRPRLSRGTGKYAINDLKQRTEQAGQKSDRDYADTNEPPKTSLLKKKKEATPETALRVPNTPFNTKLTRAEAEQIGLLDKDGKLIDVDMSRRGFGVIMPKDDSQKIELEVQFGDLFTSLATEEKKEEVKQEWDYRLRGDALLARDMLGDRRAAAKEYLKELKVHTDNGNRNVERTQAAAHAVRQMELALAEHAVGILKKQQEVRFAEALAPLMKPDDYSKEGVVMAHGLREVVWNAIAASVQSSGEAEPILKPDAQSSIQVVAQLAEHIDAKLRGVTDNAHLQAVYEGTRDKFGSQIALRDWHQVGHQINQVYPTRRPDTDPNASSYRHAQ